MVVRSESKSNVKKHIRYADVTPLDTHKIALTFYVWAMIIFGIAGFVVGFNIYTPLNQLQIKDCEWLAKEIYNTGKAIEFPQEYSINYSISDDAAEIYITVDKHLGSVIGIVQDGKLAFEHRNGASERILSGIGITVASLLFVTAIASTIAGLVEGVKSRWWEP